MFQYRIEFISKGSGRTSSEIGGSDNTLADGISRLWQALGYHLRRPDAPIIYAAVLEHICVRCLGSGQVGKRIIKVCPSCKGQVAIEHTAINIPFAQVQPMAINAWWDGEGPRP